MVVIKEEKACLSVKCERILRLLCCLSDSFINKHCRAWSSMISLWIDFRTCQKYRILLSARQRSNNYLELSRENVLGNMMLSCWPCFIWKFFMIWFHKLLTLISRKQPSCPRDIYTEHCRKPFIFTTFFEIFWEAFECSGKNFPNSSCDFTNLKSVFLQILYHSSVSWDITPL